MDFGALQVKFLQRPFKMMYLISMNGRRAILEQRVSLGEPFVERRLIGYLRANTKRERKTVAGQQIPGLVHVRFPSHLCIAVWES